MSDNHVEILAHYRAPRLYRDEEGRAVQAGLVTLTTEVTVRRVDNDAFRYFPDGAPDCLYSYYVHGGRAWLPVRETGRPHAAWNDGAKKGRATIGMVAGCLTVGSYPLSFTPGGRGPLSVRRPAGMNGPKTMDGLVADDTLCHRATEDIQALFADRVAHNGAAVFIATPLPVLRLLGMRPMPDGHSPWHPAAGLPPLTGPAIRADLCEGYLALAGRFGSRSGTTRRSRLARVGAQIVEHADRAGIAFDDADVDDFVQDLPGLAWDVARWPLAKGQPRRDGERWLDLFRRRHEGMPAALLGSLGAIRPVEALGALEAALALNRAAAEMGGGVRAARFDEWVRAYAETFAMPRLLAREGLPEPDADALAALAP